MKKWYMLTLVGADRPGIVAAVTDNLYRADCNLGEASMARLGGNFAIMLMVETERDLANMRALTEPVASTLGLHLHLDRIEARLHNHSEPNARITVFGADRAGIVAEVTGVLATHGFNILDLNSDVGGTEAKPIYIMVIDGYAAHGTDEIERALAQVRSSGIDVRVTAIDTMIG